MVVSLYGLAALTEVSQLMYMFQSDLARLGGRGLVFLGFN